MMKARTIYLLLSVAGLVLPYWQFIPWTSEHGLKMDLFFQQLFANRISAFFGMDVFVSAAVVILFVTRESSRLNVRHLRRSVFAMLLLVGVSMALPAFLYIREVELERAEVAGKFREE